LRKKYDVPFEMRMNNDELYVTDNGNYIVDASFEKIDSPSALSEELKAMVGVVDHGLFVDIAELVIVGYDDGSTEIVNKK
jgi:ribose 5-phosphate isomerase A